MSIFSPHGQYVLSVENRVFTARCSGLWNAESMALYAKDCFEKTSPLYGEPWAMMTDLRDWELATPDCEPTLIWLLHKGIENGLCKEAVITDQGRIKLRQFNVSMPEGTENFERQFFEDEASALAWLSELGFNTTD